MGTPCAIIVRTATGYLGLYCHFDGFLDSTGTRLVEQFSDAGAIERLLSGGHITAIGRDGSIRRRSEDPCTAVPCHEAPPPPIVGASAEEVARQIYHFYAYVWDGEWKVADWRSEEEFRLLTFEEAGCLEENKNARGPGASPLVEEEPMVGARGRGGRRPA